MYAGVPADMTQQLKAGDWLKAALEVLGGRGGGKPTTAQGQGTRLDRLPDALAAAERFAGGKLGGAR